METIEIPVELLKAMTWLAVAIVLSIPLTIFVFLRKNTDDNQHKHNVSDARIKNERANVVVGINAGVAVVKELVRPLTEELQVQKELDDKGHE